MQYSIIKIKMFHKKQQTLKFYPSFSEIYSFCCAYDGTYVLQGQFKVPSTALTLSSPYDYKTRLMHISADGEWIKYKKDLTYTTILKMMNSHEVTMLHTETN